MTSVILAALLLALPAGASVAASQPREGQHAQPPIARDGYRYQLFLPRGYLAPGDRRWPLLLFLHGSGERGDDIARVKVHGPPKVADRSPDFPFVTVSPLLPADDDWDVPKLEAILDHAVARYRIDRSRIYLTGLSRGGHATWRWGAAQPGRFAAIVPVSGRGDPSQACKLKQTPLWAFHGDRDDIVTPFGSFAMVEAVRSCGGKPRLTIYPDTGHDAWTRTYDDPALYTWLLEHKLPTRQVQDKKMTRAPFPDDFLWGCATAAYQIEGSPLADGAGPSIWQRFSHDPRLMADVARGDTGDIACDHYNRMEDDVRLMKELGLQAYRFSTAWSRILPEGVGRINEKGLDFYERLVDALLANGIEPLLTLYHWDLPAALDDRGGWLNRDSADWFAEYASLMFERFDGRVRKWVTLNEPWVITDGGYLHGALAPGHRNMFEAPIASHNLMRSHGAAVKAYRAVGAHEIGLVVNIEPKYPASRSTEDLAATNRADAYMNRQYLDPALLGSYPAELVEVFGEAWPEWPAEDFDLIRQPIDFIGINYYTRNVVKHDAASWPLAAAPVRQAQSTYTETGWEVFAQGLTDVLLWAKQRYGDIPLYVTENGAAFYDPPRADDGRIEDPLRVAYFKTHLAAVADAIEQGVDVRGYMAWSLLDNLEWALGYSKRFGIVHVDFETQQRTPKDSARFYSRIIASNGAAVGRERERAVVQPAMTG